MTTDRGSVVGDWLVVEVDGEPSEARLSFHPDGSLTGRGPVNRVRGTYRVIDGRLEVDGVATTLMAGPAETMEAERRFHEALGVGGRVHWQPGQLVVTGADGSVRLRLRERPREVTGTVTYRERMAMPPAAEVVLRLVDSRGEPIDELRIPDPGEVPVAFSMPLPPDGEGLALEAEIRVEGAVWWATPERRPAEQLDPVELVVVRASPGRSM